MTSLSKHFMATDMSVVGFLGVLGHRLYGGLLETCWYYRLRQEELKMSVKTLANWSVHALSTRPGNPSGPAAL